MKLNARLAALSVISTAVLVSLVLGCSSRDQSPDVPSADSGLVSRTSDVLPASQHEASLDPLRGGCAPEGVIGAANPSEPGPFLATFDGDPAEPLPLCGAVDWDVIVHSRAPATWYALDPMDAQHGPDCAGPPATHHLSGDHADAFFQCRNHVMTSLNGSDYGVIYFVPNQLVDLSDGPVTIRFDMSTERLSKRDWIDLWVSPWEQNLVLPLEEPEPDLQGPPANSIQVANRNGEGSPVLLTTRNSDRTSYHAGWEVSPLGQGVRDGTNEAAARQSFQLTISNSRAKFERLASETAPALVFWDETIDFPFETAVLQFGHHSYNPTKDDSGVPATWHWDNIGISKAIPFQIDRAVARYADVEHPSVRLNGPSTDGSMLRFAAIGSVEVSTDGGSTWVPGRRQDSVDQVEGTHHPEHFSSYWMPISAGVDEVQFRFAPDDWYQGPYFVQGIAVWSR